MASSFPQFPTQYSGFALRGQQVMAAFAAPDAPQIHGLVPSRRAGDAQANVAFAQSLFPRSPHLRACLRGVLRSDWWRQNQIEPRGHLDDFIGQRSDDGLFVCHHCSTLYSTLDQALHHFRGVIHLFPQP